MRSRKQRVKPKKLRNFIVGVFLLILLASISLLNEDLFEQKESLPIIENGSIEVFFCPQDYCEDVMIKEIQESNYAFCAFYDVNLENLTSTLLEKKADVLIFEKEDENAPEEFVRVSSKGLMHNKFCSFDITEKTAHIFTGSTNPTHNGVEKNNNNLLIIQSQTLAHNYYNEFLELQDKKQRETIHEVTLVTPDNKQIVVENYFCPEDNCEQEILSEIKQAKQEVYFMTFTFTSDPIGELLVQKINDGVLVSGVFEARQKSEYWEYERLEDAGAKVQTDTNPQTMHHKVFIIDPNLASATVITGSMNPTKSANEKNDENILIIHDQDIAKKFMEEFERVFVTT